uniref:Uncharacterized protein n=1 Tax=Avena sativa TaxID=4498 RepID=A0ACD5ZAC0_AVESA
MNSLLLLLEVWDGKTVKLSFKRNFSPHLMQQWYELEQICLNISFLDNCDSLIWEHTTNEVYSASSLYNIISFRGVVPIFIPSVWELVIPTRGHIFLWLFAHNKLMTRYNL